MAAAAFSTQEAIMGSCQFQEPAMKTARLFRSGRSQAVRLPKEFRFKGAEVSVQRFGHGVLLLLINDAWAMLEAGLAAFEPGFTLEREQPPQQVRAEIAA